MLGNRAIESTLRLEFLFHTPAEFGMAVPGDFHLPGML